MGDDEDFMNKTYREYMDTLNGSQDDIDMYNEPPDYDTDDSSEEYFKQ